ncbi:MAG: metal-dependent hydrolase [Ardenticatenales bacterium]|nr:metal-dependent hydrolase [Ardenticatenales bacterium]
MSSFGGHSLVALGIYALGRRPAARWQQVAWAAWLTILALAPDIDYLFPLFYLPYPTRLTHSVLGSLLLPLLTAAALFLAGQRSNKLWVLTFQALLAGLSHPLLDMLVGVMPLPLLWPLTSDTFRLPFGLLPSAGSLRLVNYFFYRNLLIELGVLLPLFLALHRLRHSNPNRPVSMYLTAALLAITALFMAWAATLQR